MRDKSKYNYTFRPAKMILPVILSGVSVKHITHYDWAKYFYQSHHYLGTDAFEVLHNTQVTVMYCHATNHIHYMTWYVIQCSSNWPVSCTSHYLVRPSSTWSMMSSYLLTAVAVYFDQPTTEYVVLRTRNCFGYRAFSVAGNKIWNDLPPELRHVDISFGQFRNMLKSYLFRF